MTDDESDIENMDIVADYEDNPDSSGVGYMSPPLSRLTLESDLNYSIYRLTVALCDPLQQPPDNDKQVYLYLYHTMKYRKSPIFFLKQAVYISLNSRYQPYISGYIVLFKRH